MQFTKTANIRVIIVTGVPRLGAPLSSRIASTYSGLGLAGSIHSAELYTNRRTDRQTDTYTGQNILPITGGRNK